MQILILGMHRSGTSATARLINMMGAYFAPEGMELAPKPDNPKGFWERRDALKLNNELLRLQHCTWDNLAQWQFDKAAQVPDTLASAMHAMIASMEPFRPWFLKDPRMCLTLPAWLPLLEVPVAVMVYRDPLEITLSITNRNPLSAEYALALWEFYSVGMLNATQRLPRIFIKHEDIMQRPMESCEFLLNELAAIHTHSLTLPKEQEVFAFIDPQLYRSKTALAPDLPSLTNTQQQLCELLCGTQNQHRDMTVSAQAMHLIHQGPGKV